MESQIKHIKPILEKYGVKTVLDCSCGSGLQAIGLAMDVLNNEEIKEGCKNMEEELKSGITLDEIIDRIEQII